MRLTNARMKRAQFVLLLTLLTVVLAGCFSGGVPTVSERRGEVVITVRQSGVESGGIRTLAVPAEATHVRVRLFGAHDRNIVDEAPFSNGEASIRLSVPTGVYEVHVLAYSADGDHAGVVLTAGVIPSVAVQAGERSTAQVTLTALEYERFEYPQDYVREGTRHSIRLVNFESNSPSLTWHDNFRLLTSVQPWSGDTINFPPTVNVQGVQQTSSSGGQREHSVNITVPNEVSATLYFQLQRILPNEYSRSFNYVDGKRGLRTLYVYLPSTTLGQALGEIRVTPPGDLDIIID